jgi:hypothetical protein
MGQFSVEKPVLPGSALSGNQQKVVLGGEYTFSRLAFKLG